MTAFESFWIPRFALNTRGRDFAVGDIHGAFEALQHALEAIGFDTEIDRLFCVGDLVDLGPESHQVLAWLGKPLVLCRQWQSRFHGLAQRLG